MKQRNDGPTQEDYNSKISQYLNLYFDYKFLRDHIELHLISNDATDCHLLTMYNAHTGELLRMWSFEPINTNSN